ncbi:SHOCT domain-containing protein [Limimaricola litoreus]|uniref:SHOCT domain-containing protein n=1 Tax=Limimaricola litoreus TaxID=2955316 RepID=A0A9X2FSQ3_9RHOB|nr:SHOCT domain-containing protein [Limimaricola litoreus]MCP1169449.1 SHOCT domain-containing protein [Limimaricola litoreus]
MRQSIPFSLPALIAADPAIADPETFGAYGHHMGGWGAGIFGLTMMLLFWAALIAIVVLAFQWIGKDGPKGNGGKASALAVLKDRFARGEIDIEDFEARKKALSDPL